MCVNYIIKHSVEIIEQVNHLHRCAISGNRCETHDVREIYGDIIKHLSEDGLTTLQLLSNGSIMTNIFT